MAEKERENKKIISFTIATKIIKYLGINPLKEAKNLYADNFKMRLKKKKSKMTQTNRKIGHVLGFKESIL